MWHLKSLFGFILLSNMFYAGAQQKNHYFLAEWNNKDTSRFKTTSPNLFLSEKSIARRIKYQIPVGFSDIPVSASYLQQVGEKKLVVSGVSKWLNAAVIKCKSKQEIDSIRKLVGLKRITYLGQQKVLRKEESVKDLNELISTLEGKVNLETDSFGSKGFYGKSELQLNQLNIPSLHRQGYTGKDVLIAVMDAGFRNLPRNPVFRNLFLKKRILLTRDFISSGINVYDDDAHGTAVLSCMAAYQPNTLIGSSYDAGYILLRTEDESNEMLLEEITWILAAEYADSIGVDIIQSSLGYNEFDDMTQNHRIKEMDGKTTFVARGAKLASDKGIMVINSSGNEGDKDWRKIVTPADVKEVFTVGGVDSKSNPALFSSVGPTADKRVKPDFAALAEEVYVVSEDGIVYHGNGTSYACPLVAGLAACLLQATPEKSNLQIADALRLASNQYYDPDKYIGFGIPDGLLALKILGGDTSVSLNSDRLLDIRLLSDNQVHLTVYCHSPQKYEVQFLDQSGKILYAERNRVKQPGVFRFKTKTPKKWKSSIYSVSVLFAKSVQTLPLNQH